jgi:hypothetical protein
MCERSSDRSECKHPDSLLCPCLCDYPELLMKRETATADYIVCHLPLAWPWRIPRRTRVLPPSIDSENHLLIDQLSELAVLLSLMRKLLRATAVSDYDRKRVMRIDWHGKLLIRNTKKRFTVNFHFQFQLAGPSSVAQRGRVADVISDSI